MKVVVLRIRLQPGTMDMKKNKNELVMLNSPEHRDEILTSLCWVIPYVCSDKHD